MNGEETDVLLATLISLLKPPIPPVIDLLNALADNDGSPEAAARALGERKTKPVSKRKRADTDLDNWLNRSMSTSAGPSTITKRVKPTSQSSGRGPDTQSLQNIPKPVHASSTSSKPIDLMKVLRAPSAAPPTIPRLPPLTLTNPAMVQQHTPCTLHYSVLPPELACELFYTMLDAAQGWSRNKWWLFDRLVESPHRTSFFVRLGDLDSKRSVAEDATETWKEAAQYWYNGRKSDPPLPFPDEMEAACKYIENVVNEEIQKRERFPLEWASPDGDNDNAWRANVAASNCYEGAKETVGFHSDQLTYLGPYPTIASLSLGTTRTFRLREVIPSSDNNERQAQTYNIPLRHNSLIIMHASTQERFKHCVPPQSTIDIFRPPFPRRRSTGNSSVASAPAASEIAEMNGSNCRINITFRFYRPDYRPDSIPRCSCGVPCVLRPDMKNRVDRKTALGSSVPREILSSRNANEMKEVSIRRQGGGKEDDNYTMRYWWTCYSGAQTEGKGCGMWKDMDIKREGRGPFIGDNILKRRLDKE